MIIFCRYNYRILLGFAYRCVRNCAVVCWCWFSKCKFWCFRFHLDTSVSRYLICTYYLYPICWSAFSDSNFNQNANQLMFSYHITFELIMNLKNFPRFKSLFGTNCMTLSGFTKQFDQRFKFKRYCIIHTPIGSVHLLI